MFMYLPEISVTSSFITSELTTQNSVDVSWTIFNLIFNYVYSFVSECTFVHWVQYPLRSDPPELDLQGVVNPQKWVLGHKLGFSTRAVCASICWPILLALYWTKLAIQKRTHLCCPFLYINMASWAAFLSPSNALIETTTRCGDLSWSSHL